MQSLIGCSAGIIHLLCALHALHLPRAAGIQKLEESLSMQKGIFLDGYQQQSSAARTTDALARLRSLVDAQPQLALASR